MLLSCPNFTSCPLPCTPWCPPKPTPPGLLPAPCSQLKDQDLKEQKHEESKSSPHSYHTDASRGSAIISGVSVRLSKKAMSVPKCHPGVLFKPSRFHFHGSKMSQITRVSSSFALFETKRMRLLRSFKEGSRGGSARPASSFWDQKKETTSALLWEQHTLRFTTQHGMPPSSCRCLSQPWAFQHHLRSPLALCSVDTLSPLPPKKPC